MNVTKEEIYGYIGSSIFCLLIVLLLFLTVIKTTVKSGEEGILVSFGNVDMSAGTFEPRSGTPQNQISTPPPVRQQTPQPEIPPVTQPRTQNNAAPVITQNTENTVAIETARREREERERQEAAQRAQQAKEEEERRRIEAINQQISGAFGSSATGQNQSGTGTTGTGIQGDPNSTTSAGSPTGTGYGEFNLGGRTLGAGGLPRPAYTAQVEGRIVLNITVDTNGNVIFAEIGRGTTIENTSMRSAAIEAARKAKFNRISGNNNQSGTITYRYRLN
jgi:TonB family protein